MTLERIGKIVQRLAVGVVLAGFLVSLVYASLQTQAQQAAVTWLNTTKQPGIERGVAIDTPEYQRLLELKRGYSAGLACIDKRVAIKRVVNINLDYYSGCWYETKLGLLDEAGRYLLEPGTTIAGRIKGNSLDTSTLHPTPNPNVFLELIDDAATGYGHFVNFRTIDTAKFDHAIAANGAITLSYRITVGIPRLKSATRSSNVQANETWYSQDGKWMLHVNDTGAVYRINLETFQVLSIKLRDKPEYSKIPAMADITNDGRYIAMSINSATYSELFVVDALSCASREGSLVVTPITSCQTRKLKSFLQNNISSYSSIALPRFYGNDTLGIYHPEMGGYRQYILQAPDTVASGWDYVALGDSFASGEGAFDYMYGTDDPDNKCHTSLRSYPYLIEQEVNLTSFRSVACSGAKIEHVTLSAKQGLPAYISQEVNHPGSAPQILQLKETLHSNERPDILTVSISGNDIGFSDRIRYCVLQNARCYSSYEDRLATIKEINNQYDRLAGKNGVYTKLKDAAAPNAKIYAVGYPKIVNPDEDADCGVNVRLNGYQRTLANDLVTYFNEVIKRAAHDAGVYYVDVEAALVGHRLCEAGSAATAVNGITSGNDKFLVIGSESYHPNELGHQLLQKAVLARTDHFTAQMPQSAPRQGLPNAEAFAFLAGGRDGRMIATPYYVGNDRIPLYYKNGSINYEQGGLFTLEVPVLPMTRYDVFLRSEPVQLGTITSDELGTLRGQFAIPDSVEPGMHALHVTGQGANGEPIDLYQYVYFGANEADFDGDGTVDENEACGVLEPLGQDIDRDGIDDSCDLVIGPEVILPPEKVEEPQEPGPVEEEPVVEAPPTQEAPVETEQPSPSDGNDDVAPIQDPIGLPITLPSASVALQGAPIPASLTASTLPVNSEVAITPGAEQRYMGVVQSSAVQEEHQAEVVPIEPSGQFRSRLFVVLTLVFTLITLLLYAKTKQRKQHA